jgi:hypothetical protein
MVLFRIIAHDPIQVSANNQAEFGSVITLPLVNMVKYRNSAALSSHELAKNKFAS